MEFPLTSRYFFYRGGANTTSRGGQQVHRLLADHEYNMEGRRSSWSVPRTRNTAGSPDPQHRHHDGHVRGSSLYPDKPVPARHKQQQQLDAEHAVLLRIEK